MHGQIMTTQFIPLGHNTVSPYLLVPSVVDTLAFLSATFDAVELQRVANEDGSVRHAEARIGDSVLMMGERASATLPASIHVYVPDVDETYRRALSAGATSLSEPRDLPYGDRSAGIRDPQGNLWWLGTHLGAT